MFGLTNDQIAVIGCGLATTVSLLVLGLVRRPAQSVNDQSENFRQPRSAMIASRLDASELDASQRRFSDSTITTAGDPA